MCNMFMSKLSVFVVLYKYSFVLKNTTMHVYNSPQISKERSQYSKVYSFIIFISTFALNKDSYDVSIHSRCALRRY